MNLMMYFRGHMDLTACDAKVVAYDHPRRRRERGMKGLDDWIDRCQWCGSSACYGACQANRRCDGCGADEGTISVYTPDGDVYCCMTCRKGGRCDCARAGSGG